MKVAIFVTALIMGSVANANWSEWRKHNPKTVACQKRLAAMPGANVIYTCEFGRIVEIRNGSRH